MDMDLKTTSNNYINELKQKWLKLQNTDNVFAYNLNIEKSKYLPGNGIFYMEYNPQRTRLRRFPQIIDSLKPVFNEEAFNFKKIKPLELLMNIPFEGTAISMLINRSPLTRYHTLICPDVAAGQPQRLTLPALRFCVTFLLNITDEEKAYRIGYNSPGALASVNHLHLHLLYVTADLYCDKAELEILQSTYIYRLSDKMPTEAICYIFNKTNNEEALNAQLQQLFNFIIWLCDHDIPHNLFLTSNRNESLGDILKVFVFCRKSFCYVRNLNTYNIGFCEVSGYVAVGDEQLYESLTEQEVLTKIQNETGDVFKEIYKYFKA